MLCFLCSWAVCGIGQQIHESLEVYTERDYRYRSNEIAPVLVYDASFFERFSPRTIGDMLRRLPGVTGDGDAGEFSEVQLRGIGPEYTNVLVNGQPVPSGDHGGIHFVDRIPASMVASIEIIRSPTADLDPSGVGGVINIKLKRDATRTLALGLQLVDGEPDGQIAFSYGLEKSHWQFGVHGNAQERFNPKTQHADIQEEEHRTVKQETNLFRSSARAIKADLSWYGASGSSLRFDTWLIDNRETEDEDSLFSLEDGELIKHAFDDGRAHQDERLSSLLVKIPDTVLGHIETELRYGQIKLDDLNQIGEVDDGQRELEEIERNLTVERKWQWSAQTHVEGPIDWVLGLGFLKTQRDADQTITELEGDEVDESGRYRADLRRLYGFATVQWAFKKALQAQMGIRVEDVETLEETQVFWFPSFHLRWNHGKHHQIRTSLARTIRFPDFRQLVPFSSADLPREGQTLDGNPLLRPETAWGLDLGYDFGFQGQQGVIGINLFMRLIEDRIDLIQVEPDLFTYQNVNRGHLWGMELDLGLPLTAIQLPEISLYLNATLQDSSYRHPQTGHRQSFNRQADYVVNMGWVHQLSANSWSYGVYALHQSSSTEFQLSEIVHIRNGTQLECFFEKKLGSWIARLQGSNLLQAQRDEDVMGFDGLWSEDNLIETQTEREFSKRQIQINLSRTW